MKWKDIIFHGTLVVGKHCLKVEGPHDLIGVTFAFFFFLHFGHHLMTAVHLVRHRAITWLTCHSLHEEICARLGHFCLYIALEKRQTQVPDTVFSLPNNKTFKGLVANLLTSYWYPPTGLCAGVCSLSKYLTSYYLNVGWSTADLQDAWCEMVTGESILHGRIFILSVGNRTRAPTFSNVNVVFLNHGNG